MKEFISNKISELNIELYKLGFYSESSLISLLFAFAGYDDEWQNKIEELAKDNPKPF